MFQICDQWSRSTLLLYLEEISCIGKIVSDFGFGKSGPVLVVVVQFISGIGFGCRERAIASPRTILGCGGILEPLGQP